jgi:hypothetical protein
MDNVTIIRVVAGLIFLVIFFAMVLIPYWMIFKKAGFSPWIALFMWIPFVNIVVLYIVAFSRWKVVPIPQYPYPPPPRYYPPQV